MIEFANDCYSKFIKSFEQKIINESDSIIDEFIINLVLKTREDSMPEIASLQDDWQRFVFIRKLKDDLFSQNEQQLINKELLIKLETIRRLTIDHADDNDISFIKKYYVASSSRDGERSKKLTMTKTTISLAKFCLYATFDCNLTPILLLLSTLKSANINNNTIEDKISMQMNGRSRKWLEFGRFCEALY